jgi:hypothetical protein
VDEESKKSGTRRAENNRGDVGPEMFEKIRARY